MTRAAGKGRERTEPEPMTSPSDDEIDRNLAALFHLTQLDEDGRLFLSAVITDWHPLLERGIDTIIDLEGGLDHDVPTKADKILYIYLPIEDGQLPDLDRLHAVSKLGAELMQRGDRVLVHCGMGMNRSALVAALILMYGSDMDGPAAIARIRERRPGALFNSVFEEYLLKGLVRTT